MAKKAIPIYLLLILSFLGLFFLDPIAQDVKYHSFADQNTLLGIPNFWNVLSNLPFLITGLWGLRIIVKQKAPIAMVVFFIGIILVGPGSAYYHWNPNNITLIWDRLPMTIAFTSFFIWILSIFISDKIKKALIPALLVGAASVVYWAMVDDLRFYAWVQFAPMLIVAVLLLFYKITTPVKRYVLGIIGAYVLAKLCETFDPQIYDMFGNFMSGHAIKHVFASIAPVFAALYFRKVQA